MLVVVSEAAGVVEAGAVVGRSVVLVASTGAATIGASVLGKAGVVEEEPITEGLEVGRVVEAAGTPSVRPTQFRSSVPTVPNPATPASSARKRRRPASGA